MLTCAVSVSTGLHVANHSRGCQDSIILKEGFWAVVYYACGAYRQGLKLHH